MIQGSLNNITFRNEDNGYSILKVIEDDTGATLVVVGSFPHLHIGETIAFEGSWIDHPKFGKQFKATNHEVLPPQGEEAIVKYLSSGLFRGVGPTTAQRIFDVFGLDTLELLKENPERISEVETINEKKAIKFLEDWEENIASQEMLYFLYQLNVPTGTAMRIYEKFGSTTKKRVSDNPYILAEEVWGIGFVKADDIARKLQIESESYFRIRAGILYSLEIAMQDGHCYLPKQELLDDTWRLLDPTGSQDIRERTLFSLDYLIDAKKVITFEEHLYLPEMYDAEKGIANRVITFLDFPKAKDKTVRLTKKLAQLEQNGGLKYSDTQKEFICKAVQEQLFILTGGPGTGKTTTLLGILHLLKELDISYILAAPTGRAAKRMSEVCCDSAQTIHRLLKYEPSAGFFHNESEPLKTGVVIIDEASMIDTHLMYALVRAIPNGTRLILIGDKDQLPSVGPGNILRELLSVSIPQGSLETIFRQAEESAIPINAQLINRGDMPVIERQTNFHIRDYESREEAQNLIVDLVSKKIPNHFKLNPVEDIQVLTPMHRGEIGTLELNKALQARLNPKGDMVKVAGTEFRVGDKVMQLKNNYDKNIFNGDIGYISWINRSDKTVSVDFDEPVKLEYNEMEQVSLAYASTIHKSQGSEYKVVVVVLDASHYMMLQRNLLYTAITRAKERIFLIANMGTIKRAITNNRIIKRNTNLGEFVDQKTEFMAFLEE
ncbi:MAG: ATP-dependent RecD-like DNA helicase [Fibrobacterales bacterium]